MSCTCKWFLFCAVGPAAKVSCRENEEEEYSNHRSTEGEQIKSLQHKVWDACHLILRTVILISDTRRYTYLCLNSQLWIQLTAHSVLLIVATSYSHVHFLWTPLCNVSSLPPHLPLSLFSLGLSLSLSFIPLSPLTYACVGIASHCSQAGGHCYAVKGSGRKEIRGGILVDEA